LSVDADDYRHKGTSDERWSALVPFVVNPLALGHVGRRAGAVIAVGAHEDVDDAEGSPTRCGH
jgi:hypothetical protein